MDNKLTKLVDKLEKIEEEIKQWFYINIQHRLNKCNTQEEVIKLKREVSYYCHYKNGQYREMPSYIQLQFCLKISSLDD